MLNSVIPKLACPGCRNEAAAIETISFGASPNAWINDGALVCAECKTAFPVLDGLLEFVRPALVEPSTIAELRRRHQGTADWHRVQGAFEGSGEEMSTYADQLKQREHFDGYADGLEQRYDEYARMPFWQAVDHATFDAWRKLIEPGEMLLDVGCADGRSSFPHLPRNLVVGFDISRKMIRRAMDRAITEGVEDRSAFFVADGSWPPFKSGTFQYAQTYGVLHHLPKPGRVVVEIQRLLRPGGIHFASENNATVLRRLFDLVMRVLPIWTEEAGEQALISPAMVKSWLGGLPAVVKAETVVFLPPHAFNLLTPSAAGKLLKLTDSIAALVPGLRANGGLLVFRIHKTADAAVGAGESDVGPSA